MADRKTLCLVDEGLASRAAIVFAAHRTANTHAGLSILRVLEPMDPGLWASMGEKMRQTLRAEAEDDLAQLAKIAQDATGMAAESLLREGDLEPVISQLVDADSLIKTIVVAAGSDATGALVKAAMRGSYRIGERAIAIMIVPADMSDEEAANLAR